LEASICKAFKGETIVLLLQALNNVADGSLRPARRADNLEVIIESSQKYLAGKKALPQENMLPYKIM